MKVTSKGQVTIPLEIRKKLGIDETTELEFSEKGGKIFIAKMSKSQSCASQIRSLKGASGSKLTTEQILALTRG